MDLSQLETFLAVIEERGFSRAALRLHRGGVGYYRSSNFVHVDVGRVRHW